MLVANRHLKTVSKKFCMILTEKNDFVQIVLFRRLLCSVCVDLIFFHAITLYYEIAYCDKICSIKCQLPTELNYRKSYSNYRHIVYVWLTDKFTEKGRAN